MNRLFTWFAGRIASLPGQPVAFVLDALERETGSADESVDRSLARF